MAESTAGRDYGNVNPALADHTDRVLFDRCGLTRRCRRAAEAS